MKKNILIVSGSPRGKNGNTASIAEYAYKKLTLEQLQSAILYLETEINRVENILKHMDAADVIILAIPVYQNSVPGLVMEFFEKVYNNKNILIRKERKLLVIANSGFAERGAGSGAIKTCMLFARDIGMVWMGGFTAAPGTLIDGKALEKTGNTYQRLRLMIDIIPGCIRSGKAIPEDALHLMDKPLMSPLIYRIAGRIIQRLKKIDSSRG